jgi:hypothetical protein
MNRIRNAKKLTVDGVLFLSGVYKKDCRKIEDFFTDRLLGSERSDAKQYDRIPLTFTGLENHPKNTNLACWNCCRTFKGRPWFEPQSIDPVSKGSIGSIIPFDLLNKNGTTREYCISIKGNFCGPNCVRRHINTYTRDMSERLNKIAMLKFVYEIFMGQTIADIQPALPHTDMVQYGGNLTVQEYQKKMDELDVNYQKEINDNSFANTCREYATRLWGE